MNLSEVVGFWEVTEMVTLHDCEEMALEGTDVRFENGCAFIAVYREVSFGK